MPLKYTLAVIAAILLLSKNTSAQNEANIWYFGTNAGVDFNSGVPVVLTNGVMDAFEGCASIADAAGSLLFYTDGITVWNKNHNIMVNGTGLMGNFSSTQSGVIVPQPGNPNIYYLFTIAEQTNPNGFRYSIIDISLQGGLGEVTVKNIPILTPSTEKITAVHKNPNEIWVLTHGWNNNSFYAYTLDAGGFNTTPVISSLGSVASGNTANTIGYLKFSPDGKRVAQAIYDNLNLVEIFDFDLSTGVVSNDLILMNTFPGFGVYGVEFSPNSQVLYAANVGLTGPTSSHVYQWDLQAGSAANIIASVITMGNLSNAGALQLATDGKIYLSQTGTNFLGVVNYPDVVGTGCDFVANAVNLISGTCNYGLPDFLTSYFVQADFTFEGICFGDSTLFTITTDTADIDSVLWVFDDALSGSDSSVEWSPYHIFSDTGTFSVQLYYFYSGTMDTEILDVIIYPVPDTDLGSDTSICIGDELVMDASFPPNSTYLWQDGSIDSTFTASVAGLYFVEVVSPNGCINHDTMELSLYSLPVVTLGNDTQLCDGQVLNLDVSASGVLFLWQDGTSLPTYTISSAGTYWVDVTDANTCSNADTIVATYVPVPPLDLGNDTAICLLDTLALDAFYPGVSYQWNNGSTNSNFNVYSTGSYWVKITDGNGCVSIDSFNLLVLPPPPIDLGDDVHFCEGTSATLDASPSGSTTYLWWDNTTASAHVVNVPGTYWIEVTNSIGCKAFDTIEVFEQPLPVVNLGNDTLLCNYATMMLDALNTDKYHEWQDGANTQTFEVTEEGTYFVTVIDLYGCSSSDQIEVEYQKTPKIDLGNDSLYCYGEYIYLDASFPDASYIWNNGSTQPYDTVFMIPGIFRVDVMNECGYYSDSIRIDFHNCESCVNVPNAFTPNLDGVNDEFLPWYDCNVGGYTIKVFNRWGQLLFESHDIDEGWDGKMNGKSQELGTYAWYLTYKNMDKPDTEYFKEGYVILMR